MNEHIHYNNIIYHASIKLMIATIVMTMRNGTKYRILVKRRINKLQLVPELFGGVIRSTLKIGKANC